MTDVGIPDNSTTYENLREAARRYARGGSYDDAYRSAKAACRFAHDVADEIPATSYYHQAWKRLAQRAARSARYYSKVVEWRTKAGQEA